MQSPSVTHTVTFIHHFLVECFAMAQLMDVATQGRKLHIRREGRLYRWVEVKICVFSVFTIAPNGITYSWNISKKNSTSSSGIKALKLLTYAMIIGTPPLASSSGWWMSLQFSARLQRLCSTLGKISFQTITEKTGDIGQPFKKPSQTVM